MDISCSGWDIFLKFFGDIPWMLVHYFQIILKFSYVSQSVCLLTSMLKLDKCRDISCFGWAISLEIFGDILRMFSHNKIIINFLYICQPVSWLTFLLNLDKNRFISCSGWNVFLKIFGDIPWMFSHCFLIIVNYLHVCQSVS